MKGGDCRRCALEEILSIHRHELTRLPIRGSQSIDMFLPLQLLPARLQADDFSKTWDQVASAITERYYARQQRKAAMDGLLARYGPLAKKAGSRGQFESIVNQMIRDFHDSHFGFFTTSDQGFYLMDALIKHAKAKEMPEFGAWFAADGYTVTMVLDDSEAQRAGLRKRDTVTEVDGQPFSPVDSLRALVGKQAGLTVMRAGATLHPSVKISSEGALQMFLDASRASARIIEYHGKKIGYFHLWTQADPEFRTSLENAVFGHLRETDGFILDLRDGFGGRPEGYGDPFFPSERLAGLAVWAEDGVPRAVWLWKAFGGGDQRGIAQRQGGA